MRRKKDGERGRERKRKTWILKVDKSPKKKKRKINKGNLSEKLRGTRAAKGSVY